MTFHEMCARVSVNVIGMQNESLQYPNDTDRCHRALEQTADRQWYEVIDRDRETEKVASKKPNGDKNKTMWAWQYLNNLH